MVKKPKNLKRQDEGPGSSAQDDQVSDCSSVDATANSFQSPSLAPNATDYGLEYSNSATARDKSTQEASTRNPNSSNNMEKQKEKNLAENSENIIQPGGPKQQRKKQVRNPKQQQASATTEKPTTHIRKQLNPQSRERKFIKEVDHLQRSVEYLIPRLPFSRLVREIMCDFYSGDMKITREALGALQYTSEMYITQRLQDAYLLTLHRGRVTLSIKDLEIINYLRQSSS